MFIRYLKVISLFVIIYNIFDINIAGAQQYGCLSQYNCTFGGSDVQNLPDFGSSLGIKTVGTGPLIYGGKKQNFKLFEIFDVADEQEESTGLRPGVKVMLVNNKSFHDEMTLSKYVRSLRDGSIAQLYILDFSSGRDYFLNVQVRKIERYNYKTKFPEYITFERAVAMAHEMNFRAAAAAWDELKPYLFILRLSKLGGPAVDFKCTVLGNDC